MGLYAPACNPYARPQDLPLLQDIAKAINGEYEAVVCYTRLAEQAPNAEERQRLLEIRQDESRHYRVFKEIFTRLTGQEAPLTRPSCPDTYRQGLEAAVQDELETVDFYLGIADTAEYPLIRQEFFRAALDEQNHAGWFNYFLIKQCCPSR